MQPLINYINHPADQNIMQYDGHIHLFNWDEPLHKYTPYTKSIGFMDIAFKYIDEYKDPVGLYRKFIHNYLDKENTILLATAVKSKDIIEIHKHFPKTIKGFGEIKCYDEYKGKKIPYKKISTVRAVCKYSATVGNLPVYVHWEINDSTDVEKLDKLLTNYPNVPVVLCHCGLGKDYDYSYAQVVNLMRMHNNLWTDLTYYARPYFVTNPMKLLNMPKDRILLGSDINNAFIEHHNNYDKSIDKIKKENETLSKYINSDANIKRLFNL